MPARAALPVLLATLACGPARAQSTADGPDGRTGAGATLQSGAVRPIPDPSPPCRHGADGLPGQGGCPGGKGQAVATADPRNPPPFTGGVFGPSGRGPDPRGPPAR